VPSDCWKLGCEATAFSSSSEKLDELPRLGAHRIVNSRDEDAMGAEVGLFDFILNAVTVPLNWMSYVNPLAPKGRLHKVGAIAKPVELAAFPMILGQKSFSGSPLGSRRLLRR